MPPRPSVTTAVLLVAALAACLAAASGYKAAPIPRRQLDAERQASGMVAAAGHLLSPDPRQALAMLQAALALDPHSADAHHLMCFLYHSALPDTARAVQACQDAVRFAPNNGNMWNTLGEVYRAAGWVLHVRLAASPHLPCPVTGSDCLHC
jgi:Tfp pilus assembly protein PilF